MRRKHLAFAAALAVPLVAALSPAALAHVVSDREVKLLRDLPAGLVATAAREDRPDSSGLTAPNRPAWREVYHQHGALFLLIDAASRADSAGAEVAWKAIDAAFIQQMPSGDFVAAGGADSTARLGGVAVWIAELCRAEVALMNGPLQDRFRWRLTLLLPKLRRSVDFLAAQAEPLFRLHRDRPDLLLVDAQAFLLADGIYHEPVLGLQGQRFLTTALALQQSNGAFAPRGAPPLGVQARALSSLVEITLYFPAPSLEKASLRGAQWLERRMRDKPSEAARMPADAANPSPRVALRDALVSLSYQAAITTDKGFKRDAANAVARWLPRVASAR